MLNTKANVWRSKEKSQEIIDQIKEDDKEWEYKLSVPNNKGLVKIVVCDENGKKLGCI